MYVIVIPPEALGDLMALRKLDRTRTTEGIEEQLRYQPTEETRNRKPLRPGHLAEWELRIGAIRVFYNVNTEASSVSVVAVGQKRGNKLFFRGQEDSP